MQRLFTMEVRVDYKDETSMETFEKAIVQAALTINAQASLLKDHMKPQTILYSHDFQKGHRDIPIVPENAEKAAALAADGGEDVSPDLLDALNHDSN